MKQNAGVPEFKHDSIATIDESKLVELLLTDPYWPSRIVNLARMPDDCKNFGCVSLDGVPPNGAEGDIDILRCPLLRPDLATAIQVKRIKVSATALSTGQPNKLSGLKKGVEQSNLLADLGFHQVYFYVFIVVDSRELDVGKFAFAGATKEIKSLLDREIRMAATVLRSTAGLYSCEFTQTMDDVPLSTGSFGGHLVRLAQQRAQPDELTKWVAKTIADAAQVCTKSLARRPTVPPPDDNA
jgi:hypothetical protein